MRNIVPRASDSAINLLENILSFNPIKRLTPSQCLQHPFFQCFDLLSIYGVKVNYSFSQANAYNLTRDGSESNNIVYNSNNNSSNYVSNNQQKKEGCLSINNNSGNNINNVLNNEKKKIKSGNTVILYNPLIKMTII